MRLQICLQGLTAGLYINTVVAVAVTPVSYAASASPTAYPSGAGNSSSGGNSTCVNGPTNRQCWLPGFDINTRTSNDTPDTGVIREYWLSVTNVTVAPDGTSVDALVVNGGIPGPTLYADWGDYLKIHVTNNLPANGTAIHWHGITQKFTNQQDGIPGVVQCPNAPGTTETYLWRATQYGTSWYHSHFTVQFGAGIQGPIMINGPATANYDIDLGVMMVQDWIHSPPNVFEALVGIADAGVPVNMTGALVNGTNILPCDPSKDVCTGGGYRWNTTVTHGKTYRLRLANGSVQTYYRFTIDNHNFTIIANDFVPVQPYQTDNLVIGEGQRYDIVFTTNQSTGNYWLRLIYQNCSFTGMQYPNETLGIIHYDGAEVTDKPDSTNAIADDNALNQCGAAGFLDHLVPWVLVDVGPVVQEQEIRLGLSFANSLFTMNDSTFLVDWEHPTMEQLAAGANLSYYANASYTDGQNVTLIEEGYRLPDIYNGTILAAENIITVPAKGQWVMFYINDYTGTGDYHPMHLHGHNFWILSQGSGWWQPGNPNSTINTQNPPRRDTATLPAYGHFLFAFYTDNPGSWLFHCHIAWHVSQGLSLQFLERADDILPLYDLGLLNSTCADWTAWVNNPTRVFGQDDSGV